MWNKKRAHTLLIVEILASFLVLFGVTSLIVYNMRNYTQPIGFDYQNVWTIDFNTRDQPDSLVTEVMQRIKERTKTYPQVESVTLFGSNAPYSQNTHNSGIMYDKQFSMTHIFNTDLDMPRTLNVPIAEGRWFDKSDLVDEVKTIVINQPLRKKFFGDGPALGKLLQFGSPDHQEGKKEYWKVIGVTGNFKSHGEYQSNMEGTFQLPKGESRSWMRTMLVKVKSGTDANFEAQLTKDLGSMTQDWNIDVSYMENQRKNTHKITLIPIIIFLVVSGFLLINVALGLFGILNLSIAKRRSEIGLRRALGATESGISTQFVGEIWVLATFGLLIGLLFAAQFPLMNVFDLEAGIYVTAILISIVVIYLIVTLCALYPSRQAASIQPAMALHEE
ncbi:FtsX-like permease family protein [Nibrella viscosa]|uniref:FtsX-like permease family protein n=2 Tax=Nibrella viscosa TaxID=1084524 RepID=A0ABP8KS16_9BACT